jgi:adenylylsulfate kinase
VAPETKTAFGIWITGLPASGKSSLRAALVEQLQKGGTVVAVLESDALRKTFSAESGYSDMEREFFYGSLAFIGRTLIDHGISVIFDATANRRSYRNRARRQIERFVEVFVDTPLEICMQRDPKGIYRKAREGAAEFVPGVGTAYEPPENPEITVRGDQEDPSEAACRIVEWLAARGFLSNRK